MGELKLGKESSAILADWLTGPCPICGGIEGCSDSVPERLLAILYPRNYRIPRILAALRSSATGQNSVSQESWRTEIAPAISREEIATALTNAADVLDTVVAYGPYQPGSFGEFDLQSTADATRAILERLGKGGGDG